MRKLKTWIARGLVGAVALFVLTFLLLFLEATGGHDGWLCEWGYDSDGAGTTTTGCG